ncbi:MAG: nucleoside monophosphate kinase [Candidatus Gracilibacteria bacterium]|nr:nucleoside monophosphate kinase [Candidatus Gracilibacteria bacterium]
MKIVLIGIQGSGKGTQARILQDKYGFKILEMGGEFRKIIQSGTELGIKIKEVINSGNQVNDELGKAVMEKAILENLGENIVYDAFLRNERNKEVLNRLIPDYKVIYFDLPETEAKKRLLGRMYDKETGETFQAGILTNPKNGNTLIKRADDEEQAIIQRIKSFYDLTMPIVEELRKEGKIIEIDANGNIDEIALRIKEKLGL